MLFQQLVSSLGCARARAGRGVAEGLELTVVVDVACRANGRSRAITNLGFADWNLRIRLPTATWGLER